MSARSDQSPTRVLRSEYQPPDWRIDQVELHFDIQSHDCVEVHSRLSLQSQSDNEAPLVLAGRHMQLLGVQLDGKELSADAYTLSDSELRIEQLPPSAMLEIRTRINPATNTALEGLYAAEGLLSTQCEAHGFSRITYFLDRPDVLARYRVTIDADTQTFPVLLSNGNRIAEQDLDDGRHRVIWEDPFPKPCYLFALVAGDLACVRDSYTTTSGRDIAIEFYVEHGAETRCGHAIEALKQAMRWDESTYGLEYDLDTYMVVAVSSFNMGAMENKGLNIFNDRYVLVSSETATDTDFELVTAIIGHEYFHNWTGNRVTCRDWFQLSLKEGLTVFREQQFMQDTVGTSTQRIEQVRMLRERQFPEDAGPLAHPVRPDSYIEINNFYTATVYEKGAELVRMLHQMLGQEAFARGLRRYLQANDGTAATIEDFVTALQEQTDIDLRPFFTWYEQAGTPVIHLKDSYDADRRQYQLAVTQGTAPTPGQSEKKPLFIPLNTALYSPQGQQLAAQTLLLDQQEQVFSFEDIAEKPIPAPLREFSAPVNLNFAYDADDLVTLVLHESDGFTRWEAMQRLYMAHLLDELDVDLLIQACSQLLGKEEDAGLLASLLSLPSENQLLEKASVPIQPHALLARRDQLLEQVGQQLESQWADLLQSQANAANVAYSPQVAAQRSLRAVALRYLLATGEQRWQKQAVNLYKQAQNMTECLAAMSALRDCEGEARAQVMADFRQRWDQQPLVLDKWFSLQGTTQYGDAVARVRDCMQDPAFSMKNPNRVRSLIGAFLMQNPRGLHALDGSGYVLWTEVLFELDAVNPQVSARLAQALANWQRFADDNKKQMQQSLEKVLAKPGISNDLYEIVTKIATVTKA